MTYCHDAPRQKVSHYRWVLNGYETVHEQSRLRGTSSVHRSFHFRPPSGHHCSRRLQWYLLTSGTHLVKNRNGVAFPERSGLRTRMTNKMRHKKKGHDARVREIASPFPCLTLTYTLATGSRDTHKQKHLTHHSRISPSKTIASTRSVKAPENSCVV